MDCSLTGSSVHGILQARILEWVAISSSSGYSQPRDWTQVSCFTIWATREAYNTKGTTFKDVNWILENKKKITLSKVLKHTKKWVIWNNIWSKPPTGNYMMVQVGCVRQVIRAGALGWPRGRGWGGRCGRGFRMGNTWTPKANSCQCMAKTTTIL